ncbi:hypothetical protein QL285_038988 [Trifolium repens]|nr:hypothetical protein QL285_038988 [Trifolium repens]
MSGILASTPITTFKIIRLSTQGYGEIEPDFVINNYNDLLMKWSIVNQAGFCHEMDFNLSFENPTLYTGWKELILHHQLPENVEIEMAYYGRRNFQLSLSKKLRLPQIFSPSIAAVYSPDLQSFSTSK